MASHSQQEDEANRKQRQADQAIQARKNERNNYKTALEELLTACQAVGYTTALVEKGHRSQLDLDAALKEKDEKKEAANEALEDLEEANQDVAKANERADQAAGSRWAERITGRRQGQSQGQGEGNEALVSGIAGAPEVAGARGEEDDMGGGEGDGVMRDIADVPEVAGALHDNEDENMGEGDEEADALTELPEDIDMDIDGAVTDDEANTVTSPPNTSTIAPTATSAPSAPSAAGPSSAVIASQAPTNIIPPPAPTARLGAVTVSSVVKCDYEEHRDNQAMTLDLSYADYQAITAGDFPHDWTTRVTLPAEALTAFRSRYKLQDVVRMKAIIVGDEIFRIITISASHHELRTAKVAAINKDHHPTLELSKQDISPQGQLQGQPQRMGTLRKCTGPTDIVARFWTMEPRPVEKKPAKADAWKELSLRRNVHELGLMNEVRRSLHRWNIDTTPWRVAEKERLEGQ